MNSLPYEIQLEIYKYTDLQTCLILDITDKYLLNYLYKKANIKCYRDVIKYGCLKRILQYIKNNQILELKYTDFDYGNGKIVRTYKFNQSLIKFLKVDEFQIHEFEISKINHVDFGKEVYFSIPRNEEYFYSNYYINLSTDFI